MKIKYNIATLSKTIFSFLLTTVALIACNQDKTQSVAITIPDQPKAPESTQSLFATSSISRINLENWNATSGGSWNLTDLGGDVVLPQDGRIRLEVNSPKPYLGGKLKLTTDAAVLQDGDVDFVLRAGCNIIDSEAKGVLVRLNSSQSHYTAEHIFKGTHNCFHALIWARYGAQVSASVRNMNFEVIPTE